jgi:hypothetical protein
VCCGGAEEGTASKAWMYSKQRGAQAALRGALELRKEPEGSSGEGEEERKM